MSESPPFQERRNKTALITGSAKRLGEVCAKRLHAQNFNVIVHYQSSTNEAERLVNSLNKLRNNSALALKADLLDPKAVNHLAELSINLWDGVDVLVNNASLFYPESIANTEEASWDALLGCNLKAPFFLSKALAPCLSKRDGCIVNIVDIHSERGLPGYPVYSIAKAGLEAMTRILAKELAPSIRVNGVSPGAILWPVEGSSDLVQQEILARIPLQRIGSPEDIANAVVFLCCEADYMTGQILKVDGGRTLFC